MPTRAESFISGVPLHEPILQQLLQLSSFENGAIFLLMTTQDGRSLHWRFVHQVALSIVNEIEENGMMPVLKVGFVMRELYENISHRFHEMNEKMSIDCTRLLRNLL